MNIVGEIKLHLGKDYAVLRFSEGIYAFSVDTVMVPADFRGKGLGTMLIKHVLVLADALGKEVNVSVRPIGSYSEEKLKRLVSFYADLGFVTTDESLGIVYMRRKPGNALYQTVI